LGLDKRKSGVPDTFQLAAILSYTAFLAGRKINKLRVFKTGEYSDSPRLHHLKDCFVGFILQWFPDPADILRMFCEESACLRPVVLGVLEPNERSTLA
jgi:hypothetical protein